ncbi:MlaD family protein [Nocardia callitridis]|uniref:Mce/MlaD domain-containing protein n=1 Tax=Nocardia callitridis TaxID=648753 RepID=A0ABP9KIA2_9NOCA
MKVSSLLSLGSIAAITVLGAGYLTFGVLEQHGFDNYAETTMVLRDSTGLFAGSPVLLSGIEIGDVTSIDRTVEGVVVKMRMDTKFPVPVSSSVTIANLSALGEPYVQFVPDSDQGPYLRDGQTVDTEQVRLPMSIPQMSQLLGRLLRQLDPGAVGSLIQTVSTAYDGTEALVPSLARSTDLLAAALVAGAPTLGNLFEQLQKIAPDMSWTQSAMSEAAPNFTEFGGSVDQVADAVGRLFETGDSPRMYLEGNGLVPFLEKLRKWIEEAGPDLAPLAPALTPVTNGLLALAPRLDISNMISQTLDGLGDPGAIRVRITVK